MILPTLYRIRDRVRSLARPLRGATVGAALVAGLCAAPSHAHADVVAGNSSALGLHVDLDILDQNNLLNLILGADLGPVPSVNGAAPAPYSIGQTALEADVTAGSILSIGQGLIDVTAANEDDVDVLAVSASSDVDGGPGVRNADASASVANLGIDLDLTGVLSFLNLANVLDVNATLIESEAHVTGDYGALVATGGSIILDANGADDGFATINVLGVDFDVAVDAEGRVAPNTTLSINAGVNALLGDLLGADLEGLITVVLNEQILTGDGVSEAGITVNALRISLESVGAEFFNLLGLSIGDTNLISGEIIVAQSQAYLAAAPPAAAIPEPATMGMFALAGTALAARRRRTTDAS